MSPLASAGLDELWVWRNPLSSESLDTHIPALRAAGTKVALPQPYTVPLMPPALDSAREGFVRIVYGGTRNLPIWIHATDQSGETRVVRLVLYQGETVHFNAYDLDTGNRAKGGFDAGIGAGEGDRRLELYWPWYDTWHAGPETFADSDMPRVSSYMRTSDGLLTAMGDLAPRTLAGGHRIATFNPASNATRVSTLRLANPGYGKARVTVNGVDDSGQPGARRVELDIPAGGERALTAQMLEGGGADFSGALGIGIGKWQLDVRADRPIEAMSLMSSPTGHLTNLSTIPADAVVTDTGETLHRIPYLPPASDPARQGFVRVINAGGAAGVVRIEGFDDGGQRYGPAMLRVRAGQTAHFNSSDLEFGNPDKGLATGIGSPATGPWRIDLETKLEVTVLAYIRTGDGFLTSMHDSVSPVSSNDGTFVYALPIFNPGSNRNQVSLLRLVNPSATEAEVTIRGVDDSSQSPVSRPVVVSLPAGGSRSLTARELEAGATDFDGRLGDGRGKWRLTVTSSQPVLVMGLLDNPTGHLTNLSSAGGRRSD